MNDYAYNWKQNAFWLCVNLGTTMAFVTATLELHRAFLASTVIMGLGTAADQLKYSRGGRTMLENLDLS